MNTKEAVMQMLSWSATAVGAALVWGAPALAAGGDSSADAASFHAAVKASTGVMIGVPVNERGEENTNAAEIRIYNGPKPSADELPNAWKRAIDGTRQPVVDRNADSSTASDSSTIGWLGWSPWRGYGWGYNWYNYYQPYYYYYGNTYNWGYPYYYTTYYNNYSYYPYYGYRYYYYNPCW